MPDGNTTTSQTQETGPEQMLLDFLASCDAPCPACGYNLHQLTRPVCPECGLELKLSVGSDTPFKRAWAITLCINAMIAGVGALFLLLTIFEGPPPIHESRLVLVFYGPMIMTPTPLILLGMRRRFCAMSNGAQKAFMIATISLLAIFIVITLYELM